ncbi:male-cone protein 1-like [Selaginella moellendorffii]|uniref:male-cone protein 1-like n=1 Tax=Selaginella moellendorffii TaxID=88036 RepID=UPI000D1C327D|nr:male-cone protein 1-like [Selaginella moellendorffii]|eukprot:XP_024525413.1 male-cone protein 1-like [Selaginella moellendorffii]
MKTIIAMALLGLFLSLAAAQAPQDCTALATRLASCLSFLQGQAPAPDALCCSNLVAINNINASCLCSFASMTGSASGLNINTTRALELPSRCNIPNVTCEGTTIPAPGPTGENAPPPQSGANPPPGSSAAKSLSSSSWLVLGAAIVGYLSLASLQ